MTDFSGHVPHGDAKRRRSRAWVVRAWAAGGAVLSGVAVAMVPAAAAQIIPVAVELQQAVGEAPGIGYVSFGDPVIGRDGKISFSATVGTSPTVFPQTKTAYIGVPGSLQVVARQGDQAAGAPAGITVVAPNVDELGSGGLGAGADQISGPGIGNFAIFGGGAGSAPWTCYAYQGQTAPGAPAGTTYTGFFFPPAVNSSGQIAFTGNLASGPLQGTFLVSNGIVSSVALTGGAAAPGVLAPFSQFNGAPAISDSGKIVFGAATGVPGTPGPRGIWAGTTGSLQLVAVTGGLAPGIVGGVTFSTVSNGTPTINRSGNIAFRGGLADGGAVNGSNDTGIWSDIGGGGLTVVARAGAPAPGLPAGQTLGSFEPLGNGISPVLNDTGRIAFAAPIIGGSGADIPSGVFAGAPGAITAIVATGRAVPGMPAGDTLTGFSALNMNDAGQMVFMANFTGPGVVTPYDVALLSYDPSAGLKVVAMSGVPIPGIGVAPYTVSIVGDNGGYQPAALSDTGQFVFSGNFPDGFRVMEGSVPEPSAAAVMAAVTASLGLMRRRRRHGRGKPSSPFTRKRRLRATAIT